MNFKLNEFRMKNVELDAKCNELLAEVNRLNEKILLGPAKTEMKIDALEAENEQLKEYVLSLEKRVVTALKSPVDFDEMSRKTKSKTLKLLKSKAEQCLWFAESYGLTPTDLKLESKSGEQINLSLKNEDSSSKFDKEKLKTIPYSMEKFGISETGYHELTMHCPDMPRKYLICQCKDDLNKIFHIERTPGGLPGAFISLKDDLIQYLGQRETLPDSIQIKLSGDGTKVSRISSFMVMSYTEVNDHTSQSVEREKGRDLTQSYDKSPYTNRNVKRAGKDSKPKSYMHCKRQRRL